jgi:hypothetical protein
MFNSVIWSVMPIISFWVGTTYRAAASRFVTVSSCRTLKYSQLGFSIHPKYYQSKLKVTKLGMSTMKDGITTDTEAEQSHEEENGFIPPWSIPSNKSNSKAFARFRQHVNPLARRYQMRTELPEDWPKCDFANVAKPLYLDIGCE